MSLLDTNHLESIEEQIHRSGIDDESLKIDLMDHMCCLIEEKLALGNSFDNAFHDVMKIFKVSKLEAIKQETELLTKSKYVMKKRTMIVGIFSILLIVIGAILKSMHVIGANVTLMIGFILLAFGFVLFSLIDKFSYNKDGGQKFWNAIGYLGIIIFIAGIALKVLHWPINSIFLIVGPAFMTVAFLVLNSRRPITVE